MGKVSNTMLISPVDNKTNSSFTGKNKGVSQVMSLVLLASLPGIVVQTIYFGWGCVINIVWCSLVAVVSEALVLKMRGYAIEYSIRDCSALVTAWLLAVSVPALLPWWISAIGIFFAIVVCKHFYGGLGQNIFNPAMLGYAVLLISFPFEMTQWAVPFGLEGHATVDSFSQAFDIIFGGANADAVSMVTILDELRADRISPQGLANSYGILNPKALTTNSWFWINMSYLIGGIFLLQQRIFTWHAPVAMLGCLVLMSFFFWLCFDEGSSKGSPILHLFSGGTMLGAFFIATDPVSGATSNKGKIIFSGGVGILVYVIRTWGGYPDGVAFAILLMNTAAPLIDRYTRPRVHGYTRFNKGPIKPNE